MKLGLSLLEVLISMFVLTIGLLSVIALVPVGQSEMVKGAIADRTFAMGQSVYRDARARGLFRPIIENKPQNPEPYSSMWYHADGITKIQKMGATNVVGQVYLTSENSIVVAKTTTYPEPQPVAIDPASIVVNSGSVDRFPYDAAAYVGGNDPVALRRLTVRTWPDASSPVLYNPNPALPPPPDVAGLAREIFYCHDDLLLDVPGDPEQAPTGMFFKDASDNPSKRMFEPRYSWLVTLVPSGGGGRMTMSTVIFRNRDFGIVTDPADSERVYNERTVTIDWTGGGHGGGEILLTADNQKKLDLRSNSWLLATGLEKYPKQNLDGSTSIIHRLIAKWYRVQSAAPTERISATEFRQNIFLTGPDWNTGSIVPNTATIGPRAAIFEGVVGVYEKTIELEKDSLWTSY